MVAEQSTLSGVTAIAIEGRAMLLEGAPGTGKSSLALALIERGATLIGDDGVTLENDGQHVIASPPPNIAGKFEIRNVGIVDLPTTSAPVALVLRLEDAPARYRENVQSVQILGQAIPALPFAAGAIAPAERAQWALRIHGLAFDNS